MYEIDWIVAKRIVLMRAVGNVNVDEVEYAVNRLNELFEEGTAPIYVISDNRYVKSFPASLSSLMKLMKKHDKSGTTVVVGGDSVTQFVNKMLITFSGNGVPLLAKTISQGIQMLIEQDSSLPRQIHYVDTPPDAATP